MRITNFGSCIIDHVYTVPYFVTPGETLPCTNYEVHPGGKGLNQSLALSYAGAGVRHVGRVGEDGVWLKDMLTRAGVDTSQLQVADERTGQALIQVTPDGDNAIVLYGGANRSITSEHIDRALEMTQPGEFLLLQNEINALPDIMERGAAQGLRLVFNAAPITSDVKAYPLERVEVFIVNEVEGEALTGETKPAEILAAMRDLYPKANVMLTLGEEGARYSDANETLSVPAYPVNAIDSTGAGDTFTGYFLANFALGKPIGECLDLACRAAAICVTKRGAASSIPRDDALADLKVADGAR